MRGGHCHRASASATHGCQNRIILRFLACRETPVASIAWCKERLDEMCERVQREAESKADRIILDMDNFEDVPFHQQRMFFYTHEYWGPEVQALSVWENHRIIEPRERAQLFLELMADLDALVAAA